MGHTALIVSALTGTAYSAAELLGEVDTSVASREADAEIAREKLMERMKEAGM